MSINLFKRCLMAGAIVLGLGDAARAQFFDTPNTPSWDGDVGADLYSDVDVDWFAHPAVNEMGETPTANEGFYFEYERQYVWVMNRDKGLDGVDARPWDGGVAWGNRFEIGYASDDVGWEVASNILSTTPTGVPGAQGPADGPNSLRGINEILSGGVEAMCTYRLKAMYSNLYFEPMAGIRYHQIIDRGLDYSPVDNVQNNLVGPQVGMKIFHRNNTFSAGIESRLFAAWNMAQYWDTDHNAFVPAGELRMYVAWHPFKLVSITAGYDGIVFADGIGRNAEDPHYREDVVQNGIFLGFNVNR